MNYTQIGSHAGLSSVGLAPNGGSGVLWRREALNQIGGFRTDSLGERTFVSTPAARRRRQGHHLCCQPDCVLW